jgi:hypothetical protein
LFDPLTVRYGVITTVTGGEASVTSRPCVAGGLCPARRRAQRTNTYSADLSIWINKREMYLVYEFIPLGAGHDAG